MTRERLQDELVQIWSQTGLTVLFVTHAIEEAIFLADRVVVMSPGPGRIDSEYIIDLPRPRDVVSPEFNEWRRVLSSQLHSDHARKARKVSSSRCAGLNMRAGIAARHNHRVREKTPDQHVEYRREDQSEHRHADHAEKTPQRRQPDAFPSLSRSRSPVAARQG